MVYTSSVPQANQTIANSQPIIEANFGFLPTCIGQEHNFNSSDATQTYHLQASMPDRVGGDPGSLPAGTTGIYYVNNSGKPKFYNGTFNTGTQLLQILVAANFNGVGSLSFRSSYNVNTGTSSRVSTGIYTFNFDNATPNANYIVLLTGMRSGSNNQCFGQVLSNNTYGISVTTTSITVQFTNQQGTAVDVLMGNLLIFGL